MTDFVKPPKEDVFRAFAEPIELRDETGGVPDGQVEAGNTLRGHFAVFNSPTTIDSYYEGRFVEVIAPGAFAKTFRESRDQIRVLLGHGYDPAIGDKPIATITDLREDDTGAYYECELLDGLDPLVVAGLRAGQYGASFRFKVMREEWNEDPGRSEGNPDGLPQRTLKEVACREFGPCTFGAYPDATSEMCAEGMRTLDPMGSLADEVIVERLAQDPDRLKALVDARSSHMAAFSAAMDEIRTAMNTDADTGHVYVDEDGENYTVAEDGSVVERSWDDSELDAPADTEGTTPEEEARREQETQEADAPLKPGDTGEGTRPAKDYLAGATAPAWLIP